ncbi:dCMP deaminase [Streptomyces sp. M10(2022)]
MAEAIALSRRCPRSTTAFSVGAVVVDESGAEISRATPGGRRARARRRVRTGQLDRRDPRLSGATVYTSLEPCSIRKSRPASCTSLILAAGIGRVVLAWREPSLFVADCQGVQLLADGEWRWSSSTRWLRRPAWSTPTCPE